MNIDIFIQEVFFCSFAEQKPFLHPTSSVRALNDAPNGNILLFIILIIILLK